MRAQLPAIGWRVWAAGIVALGLVGLAFSDFNADQPVPASVPGRTGLAVTANLFMVAAGLAAQWRPLTVRAIGALSFYYGVIVVLLLCGRQLVVHGDVFLAYNSSAGEVAIAAAGLIAYATHAGMSERRRATVILWSQRAFGACALLFGAAHFVYFNLTAPLVPTWLPPSQAFWAYATGIAHIAAGLAILGGAMARLAAVLLTIMFAAFTPLVHLPMVWADPHSFFIWSENAVNIAFTGAAWVIADSFARTPSAIALDEVAERPQQ